MQDDSQTPILLLFKNNTIGYTFSDYLNLQMQPRDVCVHANFSNIDTVPNINYLVWLEFLGDSH